MTDWLDQTWARVKFVCFFVNVFSQHVQQNKNASIFYSVSVYSSSGILGGVIYWFNGCRQSDNVPRYNFLVGEEVFVLLYFD